MYNDDFTIKQWGLKVINSDLMMVNILTNSDK